MEQLPQLQRKLQPQLHQLHQSVMDPQVTRRTFEAPLIVTSAPAAVAQVLYGGTCTMDMLEGFQRREPVLCEQHLPGAVGVCDAAIEARR